ncbi:PAS domain S-box protein [Nodularia harveyana UHCC-0300]|uniref:histidine kinase n=1 Tax=Nodularia harveyana UHCC-0300 TaxID=2974287 RepID=A0ABU5UGA7_9CYAN|nr:PAS domain S-box protein [Nodularia harveyana]MEA5582557.1 PAS domain S-box protein [Nodularia harveyana UHCC-0300]
MGIAQLFFWDNHCHTPLVEVWQDTPVADVIQAMHQAETSCALVVEEKKIIGIFTERDVVRAIAQGLNQPSVESDHSPNKIILADITVGELMTQPVITLSEVDAEDITTIWQRFSQNHIRHLPVINHQGEILGVITPEALNAQAIELEKRAEESRKSEAKFAAILNNAVASAIVSFRVFPNYDWVCDYQSPGSEAIFGYTAEEIMANPSLWMSGVHPEDREQVIMPVYEDVFAGRTVSVEYRFYHQDGSLRWISVTYQSQYVEDGEYWIVTGTNFDITDRKQTEALLRERKKLYRSIFDLTFQFIGLLTPDGTLLEANQTALTFGGLEYSDVVNRPFWEARWWTISPDTQEELKTAIAQAAAGEFIRYQVDVLGAGDNIATIDFSLKPIKDDTGAVMFLLPEGRDISEYQAALRDRQFAELELIHNRDFKEAIFNQSSDALFLVDTETSLIADCNDRAVELFEFTNKDQLIGLDGQTLHKQKFTLEDLAIICAEINSKGFWSREIEYLTNQGNLFWGNLAIKEIKVSGEIINLIRVTDISERKQAELALQEREAMLRGIGDNLHNGMFYQVIRDLGGSDRFSYISAGVERLIEVTAEEMIKDPDLLYNQLREQDFLDLQTAMSQSYHDLTLFDMHLQIHCPSGQMKWLHFRSTPRRMDDGRVIWDGLAVDVTDLKQNQVRLEESQQVARLGNWDYNLLTGKISWSKGLFQLFRRDLAEIAPIYSEQLQLYHPEDAVKLNEAVERAIATGESYKLTLRVPESDGSHRYFEAIGNAGFNPQGEVIRLYGTAQDITEQYLALRDRQIAEAALAKSEEQFRLTLEFTEIGIWDWNILTGEVIWNNKHYELFDLDPETTIPGYEVWRNAIHPEDVNIVEKAVLNALQQNINYEPAEYRVIHADGTVHWLSGRGRGIYNQAGDPIRMLGIVMDISDRKRAAQMLELQAVITSNMAEGICLIRDTDGIIVYTNPKFEQMFGYESGELINQHVSIVNYDTELLTSESVYQAITATIRQYGEFTYQIHNVKKDGTPFWCRATTSTFQHSEYGKVLVSIQQDITEQKQADEKIKTSLKEKEVLLQEIHHRVKNNLGIVSGLLQMQCRRIEDTQAKAILKDSQNRIASIALVHEKMYRSEELADIDFAEYIPDLTTHLFDSYNVSSNRIQLNIQVDHASLDIETAIPCGLIINELVSNALKYAFPDDNFGEIQVNFYQESPGKLTLIIRDNGIGLPAEFDHHKTKTLGLTLVHGLVKQLRGNLKINFDQGTEFKITFTNNQTSI